MRNITLTIAALCAVFVVPYVCEAAAPQSRMPADTMLIHKFESHRSEFERLRQLVTADMGQRSYFSETTIANIRPEARRNEYRRLLKLSPKLEVGVDYNGTVRFIFSGSQGLAIGPGWAKGIEFIPKRARLVGTKVDGLDNPQKLPAGVYLREIEPQWYVFYQRDE
jgi:hypothetical protein